ncbi:hypothetical protein IQ07DRAFT_178478 [Pyrenochaeta sp. DS3sAY3a]|nr:hypothetical protein IQ07DRAFT_178478 [Pyrenochaeta sp. DS3sAY3a]
MGTKADARYFLKRKAADIAWLRGMQRDIVRAPESWSAREQRWLKLARTRERWYCRGWAWLGNGQSMDGCGPGAVANGNGWLLGTRRAIAVARAGAQEFTAIVVLRGQYWTGTQLTATTAARERRMADQTTTSMDNCDELEQQRCRPSTGTTSGRLIAHVVFQRRPWPQIGPAEPPSHAQQHGQPSHSARLLTPRSSSQVPPSPILQLLDT